MDNMFNIKQEVFNTSKGEVALPIFYFDFSSVIFSYTVEIRDAEKLLKDTGLKPAIFFGNKALVMLALFEYRDSGVGVYNEVGLATVCYPEGHKKPVFPLLDFIKNGENWRTGAYVHNLPVTTDLANKAGREIWSLPKFVAEIPFSLTKSTFSGAVKEPDTNEDVFTIEGNLGKMGIGGLFNGIDNAIYSIHENKLLKTVVKTKGKSWYGVMSNIRLKTGNSNHIMASNLRQLKLDAKKPIFTIISRKAKSILPLGEPV